MRKLGAVTTMLAIAFLAGCSSPPSQPAEKPQPKPAEFITGRMAFQRLYGAARGWAPDAQPFRLESQLTADGKGQGGKSAVWRGSFASAAQQHAKPYDWSGEDTSDAPARGVTPGVEDSYSANNSSTQVFQIAFIKVDSDQAFEVAQKHGGDKLLEEESRYASALPARLEPADRSIDLARVLWPQPRRCEPESRRRWDDGGVYPGGEVGGTCKLSHR